MHALTLGFFARKHVLQEWRFVRIYFHPDEMAKPTFQADDAIELWDRTNREDLHISELSQAGISSRAYTPRPDSPREELLHGFDRMVTDQS